MKRGWLPSSAPSPGFPRRFLAVEVLQRSDRDCGPAALKCLLEGLGLPIDYGHLRGACGTGGDGTSIDALESVARGLGRDLGLGLGVEQVMVRTDHLARSGNDLLPAIALVRLPRGMAHFVVLWRRLGPFIQVMDPARGRRWARATQVLRGLLIHTAPSVPFPGAVLLRIGAGPTG